jgi:dynactin complex subunit
LREKYPYDPRQAAQFETEKAAKAKLQQEHQRRDIYHTLLRQENEIRSKIDARNEDLIALQKEIKNWRSKPKLPGKAIALNQLIDKRMDLTRHVDALQKQMQGIRNMQAQYR